MIKQYLRGQHKKITKDDKVKKEAEDKHQDKEHQEHCRHQLILQKWVVLAENDPGSELLENEAIMTDQADEDENWPPVWPNKKQRTEDLELSEDLDVYDSAKLN